jgi:hypothetical protein
MFWLYVATPFVIGLLLGALTQARIAVLVLPPLAIAFTCWIVVGWNGDDYDIGRSGLILLTGILSLVFAAVWVVGSVLGRFLRMAFERPHASARPGER